MDNLGICDSTKGDCWAYNYKYRLIESKRENDFFEIVIIKEGSKEIENRIVKINDSIYYEFKDGYYNEVAPK
jgi:hypothetical protein